MNIEDDLNFANILIPQRSTILANRYSVFSILLRTLKDNQKKYDSQSLFKKLVIYDIFNATIAFISILFGILENEITFQDHSAYVLLPDLQEFLLYSDTNENNVCLYIRIVGVVLTIFLVVALIKRWKIYVDYLKSRGILPMGFKLLRSWLFFEFLLEIAMNAVTPLPKVNHIFEMMQLHGILSYYSYDTFAVLFVLCRAYLFIRLVFTLKGYKSPKLDQFYSLHSHLQYKNKPWDSFWSFKVSLKLYPLTFLLSIFVLISIWGSLVIRINERISTIYSNLDWNSFYNSIWYVTIIITAVGYGDIYPQTHMGRLFSFIVMIIGNFLLSLLIVKLKIFTSMNENQFLAYKKLKKKYNLMEIRLLKIKVIQRFWKCIYSDDIRKNFDFMVGLEELRQIRLQGENINEIGMNRYNLYKMNYLLGDYLRDIIKDSPEKIKLINERVKNIIVKQIDIDFKMNNIKCKLNLMTGKIKKSNDRFNSNFSIEPSLNFNSDKQFLQMDTKKKYRSTRKISDFEKNITNKRKNFSDLEERKSSNIKKLHESVWGIEKNHNSFFKNKNSLINVPENSILHEIKLKKSFMKTLNNSKRSGINSQIIILSRIAQSREVLEKNVKENRGFSFF